MAQAQKKDTTNSFRWEDDLRRSAKNRPDYLFKHIAKKYKDNKSSATDLKKRLRVRVSKKELA